MRIGSIEITVRRRPRKPCQACSGRGWFYTKGTLDPVPPPPGYDGVALCGCGTAHDKLNDNRRRWRKRQLRNEPPF
ncbi:hypothetical protein AB0C10_16220 [Microbispora amethystogenes]|uniref:hypothetical protein n=1 Tax=Microbispora amethystogenes TaxID=1427754 RepID=UPI0033D3D187